MFSRHRKTIEDTERVWRHQLMNAQQAEMYVTLHGPRRGHGLMATVTYTGEGGSEAKIAICGPKIDL